MYAVGGGGERLSGCMSEESIVAELSSLHGTPQKQRGENKVHEGRENKSVKKSLTAKRERRSYVFSKSKQMLEKSGAGLIFNILQIHWNPRRLIRAGSLFHKDGQQHHFTAYSTKISARVSDFQVSHRSLGLLSSSESGS